MNRVDFRSVLLPLLSSLCLSCTHISIDQTLEKSTSSTKDPFETVSAIAVKECPKRTAVPKLKRYYENTPACGGENQPICHPLQQQSPCDRGFLALAPDCEVCIKDENYQPSKGKRLK